MSHQTAPISPPGDETGVIDARRSSGRLVLLHGIFLLSGIAGLGYQMAFVRLFAVGLGHELPSVLAVVGAFFGGLALGAWLLDKPIARSARPGWWYIGLEVLIGVWGLGCVWLIGPATDLALGWMGPDPSAVRQWVIGLALPLVVLLPATAGMGATLPAMERFAAPLTRDGRCVGGLYAVNTLGAVIGTLGGAFLLVPWLGYREAVMTMAATDLLCAAMMLPLILRARTPVRPPRWNDNPSGQSSTETTDALSPSDRPRLMLILLGTGLLGIGYEVVGLRVLAQVIENTVYSYAAALAVFLIGTAVGAAIHQRLATASRRAQPHWFERWLGYLLAGLATTGLLGGLGLAGSREVYQAARLTLGDGLVAVMLSEMAVAACVFLLPTLLMGAVFSHVVQRAKGGDGGVGRAMAVNTAGGFAAPLLVGVLLLPTVGTKWTLVIVSLGYLLLIPDFGRVSRWALVAPFLLLLFLPTNLHLVRTFDSQRVVDYKEGVMASVAVLKNEAGHRFLRVNNRFQMGGTSPAAQRGQLRLGHIPLLLHPEPRRALFLGLGTGISALAAADHPELRADAVELVPQVVRALPWFAVDGRVLTETPGVTVYTADARRFVRTVDRRYDVIVADLFHPGRDGGGMLYTREHFEAIRARLTEDGLVCQWLPLYQLDEPTLRTIIRTFREVFPDARAVIHDLDLNHPALGLIAPRGDWPVYDSDWFRRRLSDGELRATLGEVGLHRPVDLLGMLVAEPRQLADYADRLGEAINTDNHPRVVYRAPAFASRRNVTSYGRLMSMLEAIAVPETPWELADARERQRLTAWIVDRNRALHRAVAQGTNASTDRR